MSTVTRYESIRDSLASFDVINCEHKELFFRLIGHTAMVYRCKATGQLMVWESTTMNRFSGLSGVQLNPLGIWLANYPGKVYIRQTIMSDEKRKYAELWLDPFIRMTRGTSYPNLKTRSGRWYLIKAALDSKLFARATTNIEDPSVRFCTDLVAATYRYCQLTTADINPSEMEPDDCRPGGQFEKYLRECALGSEIRIK